MQEWDYTNTANKLLNSLGNADAYFPLFWIWFVVFVCWSDIMVIIRNWDCIYDQWEPITICRRHWCLKVSVCGGGEQHSSVEKNKCSKTKCIDVEVALRKGKKWVHRMTTGFQKKCNTIKNFLKKYIKYFYKYKNTNIIFTFVFKNTNNLINTVKCIIKKNIYFWNGWKRENNLAYSNNPNFNISVSPFNHTWSLIVCGHNCPKKYKRIQIIISLCSTERITAYGFGITYTKG